MIATITSRMLECGGGNVFFFEEHPASTAVQQGRAQTVTGGLAGGRHPQACDGPLLTCQ